MPDPITVPATMATASRNPSSRRSLVGPVEGVLGIGAIGRCQVTSGLSRAVPSSLRRTRPRLQYQDSVVWARSVRSMTQIRVRGHPCYLLRLADVFRTRGKATSLATSYCTTLSRSLLEKARANGDRAPGLCSRTTQMRIIRDKLLS